MPKKIVVLIAVLVVMAAAAVVLKLTVFKSGGEKPPVTAANQQEQDGGARKAAPMTEVDKSKLPERFPSDIPLEAGASVTMNFNAVNNSGYFQSSREFISKKSLAENYKLYQSALTKGGWTITQAIDDTVNNQAIILATKGDNRLNIRIYKADGTVKVSINNETKP